MLIYSEISKELLVGICLACNLNSFNDKESMNINLGNIGPAKRKSENNWQPRK